MSKNGDPEFDVLLSFSGPERDFARARSMTLPRPTACASFLMRSSSMKSGARTWSSTSIAHIAKGEPNVFRE